MSLINGDKARDNRKRRSKQKMRERVRALRNAIGRKANRKPATVQTFPFHEPQPLGG